MDNIWKPLALVLLSALFTGFGTWVAFAQNSVDEADFKTVVETFDTRDQRIDMNILELKLKMTVLEQDIKYIRQELERLGQD